MFSSLVNDADEEESLITLAYILLNIEVWVDLKEDVKFEISI